MKFAPKKKSSHSAVRLSKHRAAALALLAWISLFLYLPTPASAQVLTGEIDGTVRDESGAVIPNATVEITNAAQHLLERTVKTDASGQFAAPLLSVGSYSLKVSAEGFKTYAVNDVQVHVGEPSTVPVQLSVGAVSEQIDVTANALTTQLDSAAAGTLIDTEQVTQLSLSSRNYLQLLSIQPGISGVVPGPNDRGNIRSNGSVNTQTFSVNGNGTAANGYFLHGADTLKRAGQQPVAFPGVDFVQEINLQRASYGAEFGGPGAAVVSVQTKSGETAFHGGAFGFFRSQIFNANLFFNNRAGVPLGGIRYADFGYYLGGPVWIPKLTSREHAKTFFFFGQELLRTENSVQQNITNIPTLAQRSGNFNVPVCTLYNAAGRCATTTTHIASIDPTAQQYLKDIINKLPLPNNPTDPQGLISTAAGYNNETQTLIRIDHQFNNKLSVFLRYLDDPFNLVVPGGFQLTSSIPGVATSRMTNGSTNWLGHFTYVIDATHVLEGGISKRDNWVTALATGSLAAANSPDINVSLPYPATLNQVPHINIGGSNYAVTSPYDERNPVTQIFLNSTNVAGRHTFKLGFNVELQTGGSINASANAGTFNFAPGTLPAGGATQFDQAFANFLLGKVATFTQTNVNGAGSNHSNIYEGFFQDDFHATPRLTLTGGVRYSYFAAETSATFPGFPQQPVLNFDPAAYNPSSAPTIDAGGLICTTAPCAGGRTPNSAYDRLNGIIIGGSNSRFGDTVAQAPTRNFAPRVGFAYDVFGNGKTAIRGGFGIYYFAIPANQAKFATLQNPPNILTTTISNTTFSNPGNGIPVLSNAPIALQAYQTIGTNPYSEQYSLDIQQQLRPRTVLDVGYYGNRGVHLFANEDVNQPLAGQFAQKGLIAGNVVTTGNTQVLNQIRPYPGYSAITNQLNMFTSNYNSLQASLRQRLKKDAILSLNYTWSKALTNARTPQNNADLGAEYGPTDFNRTSVFNASFVYPFPFYRDQKGFLGRILGGFEISGIIGYASGQYLTANTASLDPGGLGLLTGPASARPDILSNPNTGAPHQLLQWFNTAAFQPVPAGQYRPGNDGVANILGPGYENWDLSIFRNVRLEKGAAFQFRLEAFNTFNHTNFNTVQTILGSTNYGQVTGTGPARSLQLGAKFSF